ncbi:MAG: OmpH family outer membrane protein [Chitinophagaceae bacterium]|nr:OmpH family outer membrane protein [Chitinophagaceae bacterium]
MKNFTIGLNVVLVIAVAVLFYLHFSSPKKMVLAADKPQPSTDNAFKIAYFEMDSIESHYEYLKDVRSSLKALEQQKSNELAAMRNRSKATLEGYRKRGKTMTQEEMGKAQEELQRLDNELKTQEQIKTQELQDESIQKIQQVKKKIEEYLKDYNKNKNYAYIFASSGDIMYYKDSVYSITNEVLKGLNEQYKKKAP